MMNRLMQACLATVLVLGLAGCYGDFDDPAPAKVWEDADFAGEQLIPIRDLKQKFYDAYGKGASSLARTLEIREDWVIKGKVISSDRSGNVYKSLYLYDGTAAIELKLLVSNYVYYAVGQTVYVRTKGLAIGCYRYMLSLGLPPTEKDISKGYANRNIETQLQLKQHVFEGENGQLTAEDTLTVTPENYRQVLTDDALGCLVRLEGLAYKAGKFDGDTYPQYLEQLYLNGSTVPVYTNKYYKDEKIPGTDLPMPETYAYSYDNRRYYGSSLFTYTKDEKDKRGNLIVRVSGYADFALQRLPENGARGNITAIYTKYASKSGGYIKYQLLVNSFRDIEFVPYDAGDRIPEAE